MSAYDEMIEVGFKPEHLIDQDLDPRFDSTLEGRWRVRWRGGLQTWVVNPSSNVYAKGHTGPMVHDLENCPSLKGIAPCEERYTNSQVLKLWRADSAYRSEHGRHITGWCQNCAVEKIR